MKKLGVILIITGIILACYPLMEQVFSWYWQHKLISEWEKPVQAGEAAGDFRYLGILDAVESEDSSGQKENDKRNPLAPRGETIGVLRIETINVKLPIIKGVNQTNLKIGITYLEDTPLFGEVGNTVLAGHRGHSFGRLLNRLNEVELNDRIVVSTKNRDYSYHVFNKVIVEPEEIEILRSDKKEKILTIITCEPVYKPTHRLIVQAKLDR